MAAWDTAGADTVSINGYDAHWVTPIAAVNPVQHDALLNHMKSATYTHLSMARDLSDCDLLGTDARLLEMRRLLKYYFFGLKRAAAALRAVLNADPTTPALRRTALREIDFALILFEGRLLILGDDLTDFPSIVGRPGWFEIPNRQLLEVLIKAKLPIAPNDVLVTLQDIKYTMRNLSIGRFCRDSNCEFSMPHVFFVCLGHRAAGMPYIVACSGDNWGMGGFFKLLHNNKRDWRTARFTNIDTLNHIRDEIALIVRRWGRVNSGLNAGQNALLREAEPSRTALWEVYNTLVGDMYDGNRYPGHSLPDKQQPLSTQTGFNHQHEDGRSFYGRGSHALQEMSRCWKCRFLYHYGRSDPTAVVNTVAWAPEEPTQTTFVANKELCAEDLCHFFCSAYPPQDVGETLPIQPYFPYSTVGGVIDVPIA